VWRIAQACPQCGAAVSLGEADRLLICGYCRCRLYIAAEGPFRYLLPSRGCLPEEVIHVPYWRIRGQVFTLEEGKIGQRLLDRTYRAADLPGVPDSLGIRPQAVKLRFAGADSPGRFLRPKERIRPTSPESGPPLPGCEPPLPGRDLAFIGETKSIVYLPVLFRDGLYDRLAGRKIAPAAQPIDDTSRFEEKAALGVRFLATLCPRCGWDLESAREALVLLCRTCGVGWNVQGTRWQTIPVCCLPGQCPTDLWLPFWIIRASVKDLDLETYADLARLANLPRLPDPRWEGEALCFWIPACKMQLTTSLRLARAATLTFPKPVPEPGIPDCEHVPVTLSAEEAAETIKVILCDLGRPRAPLQERIDSIAVRPDSAQLVYAPLRKIHADFVHAGLSLCVNEKIVQFGRALSLNL